MATPLDEDEFTADDLAAAQAAEEEVVSEEEIFRANAPPLATAAPSSSPSPLTTPVPTSTGSLERYALAAGTGTLPVTIAGDVFGFAPESALRLFGQGAARGHLDELVGAAESAVTDATYEEARDRERQLLSGARDDMGAVGSLIAETAGGMVGPRVAGGWRRQAAQSAAEGAVGGAGAAETLAEVPAMMTAGGAIGSGADVLGSFGGDALRRFLGSPLVQDSPAAAYLRAQGVDALTVGQMNPRGRLNQLEEASTSVSGVGPGIRDQRDAARQQWQQVVMDRGVPPGLNRAQQGALPEQLDEMYQGFGAAYAPARGVQMAPRTAAGEPLRGLPDRPGAFERIVADPDVLATGEQREIAQNFLDNQLTLLPEVVGPVQSDVLLTMRHNIRTQARAARKAQDPRVAEMLENAADAVTDTIEHQLPEDAHAALRDADAAYRRYKVVEDAVGRSNDNPDGFSPYQLSQAVKAGTERGTFARGAGGDLRDLARAGREIFDVRVKPTGERLLAAGPAGFVTAPLIFAANTAPGRAFMQGETALQRGLAAGSAYAGQATASAARSAVDAGGIQSTHTWMTSALAENPEALGPYAQTLAQAQQDGRLASVHYVLEQTDPEYRATLERARKGL